MNDYRNDLKEIEKEARWTFWKFLPIFLMVVILLTALGFGLNSIGLFGRTVVERKVFENSFQRSESIKARIANDEAVIAQIEGQLENPNLDENTRFNLNAQANAARVRINTASRLQQ